MAKKEEYVDVFDIIGKNEDECDVFGEGEDAINTCCRKYASEEYLDSEVCNYLDYTISLSSKSPTAV